MDLLVEECGTTCCVMIETRMPSTTVQGTMCWSFDCEQAAGLNEFMALRYGVSGEGAVGSGASAADVVE